MVTPIFEYCYQKYDTRSEIPETIYHDMLFRLNNQTSSKNMLHQ